MVNMKTFAAALTADDELVRVLRGHIYIEAEVNKFIEFALADPTQLKRLPRKPWYLRIELALALGLDPQLGPPLRKLGDIRNDFAHEPDTARISDERMKELYGTLADETRDEVMQLFEEFQAEREEPVEGTFADIGPKAKFICIIMTLHLALENANLDAFE